MKMVDYVVDGGDFREEVYDTKRQAIKRAQELANEKKETMSIYRWVRPDRDSDLELDEGYRLYIEPNN
jgi:hypothetical protein